MCENDVLWWVYSVAKPTHTYVILACDKRTPCTMHIQMHTYEIILNHMIKPCWEYK